MRQPIVDMNGNCNKVFLQDLKLIALIELVLVSPRDEYEGFLICTKIAPLYSSPTTVIMDDATFNVSIITPK